eukprot:CAMPEP_0201574438 /NCGR_PEP_ID=MMETSP0190_2-20130828/18924_1 /ASSEMBLY_ACC=CAM_ASM_000263 /TAXON_ID=37353 /ORGANISM="Rosalina sp." /LENGTH=283 /DNA_ID=CAMNT_0048002679 /DNA_START=120 /DNA_END=968 /DNA_ORIENTATION=+
MNPYTGASSSQTQAYNARVSGAIHESFQNDKVKDQLPPKEASTDISSIAPSYPSSNEPITSEDDDNQMNNNNSSINNHQSPLSNVAQSPGNILHPSTPLNVNRNQSQNQNQNDNPPQPPTTSSNDNNVMYSDRYNTRSKRSTQSHSPSTSIPFPLTTHSRNRRNIAKSKSASKSKSKSKTKSKTVTKNKPRSSNNSNSSSTPKSKSKSKQKPKSKKKAPKLTRDQQLEAYKKKVKSYWIGQRLIVETETGSKLKARIKDYFVDTDQVQITYDNPNSTFETRKL